MARKPELFYNYSKNKGIAYANIYIGAQTSNRKRVALRAFGRILTLNQALLEKVKGK